MSRTGKITAGISLAIGMAFAGVAAATPAGSAGVSQGGVTFFLADPELGLAGVYDADGVALYFEARRSFDAKSGGPGALSLRVVDAEARTLALAGEPFAGHWVPQQGEFMAKEGFAYAHLLSGLGEALAASDLHASLASEQSALAGLAMQAADTPAGLFPVRAAVDARKSAAADVSQIADFYLGSVKGVRVKRASDGMLEAKLGNGIVFQSTQQFLAGEPDEEGRMGRIDAYAMVKAADGYVLGAELGGDLVPESWADAIDVENQRDHHALASDFGRAATALNALAYSGKASRGVTLSHENEAAAMQRMAQTMIEHLLPVRGDALDASSEKGDAEAKSGGRYQTYIQVWRKPFVVIAEHSGTRVGKWLYSSNTSSVRTHQGWVSFCNHGTCANAGNMTNKCTYTGPRLTSYRLPSRRSDAGGHTCSTPYWAIARKGHHNCHDDSSTQVRAVRGQSYGHNSGRCNDSTAWIYAPTCGAQ